MRILYHTHDTGFKVFFSCVTFIFILTLKEMTDSDSVSFLIFCGTIEANFHWGITF